LPPVLAPPLLGVPIPKTGRKRRRRKGGSNELSFFFLEPILMMGRRKKKKTISYPLLSISCEKGGGGNRGRGKTLLRPRHYSFPRKEKRRGAVSIQI